MTTEKDAKAAVAKKKLTMYRDVVPLASGMFSENTKISKEKMVATLHRSMLGLTKTGEARPMEDLKLFLAISNQYGLNPFKKEIYATYVWNKERQREELTPIVSIHGLRKMARKSTTPRYTHTGAAELEFSKDDPSQIISATVPVFGIFSSGVSAISAGVSPVEITRYTAYFDEFARRKKDGDLNSMWRSRPRMMLIKCAEANAIRQGFDISGLYIEEEIANDKVIDADPDEEMRHGEG
nr:MAG TPA: RecT protein [Caudoviricetes sp.]